MTNMILLFRNDTVHQSDKKKLESNGIDHLTMTIELFSYSIQF